MPPPPMICSSVEIMKSRGAAARASRSARRVSRGSARRRTLAFSADWMS
jgi:hypothetical protein